MFRNNKLTSIIRSRYKFLTAEKDTFPSASFATTCWAQSGEKSLIPEHLRYKEDSSYLRKFKKFIDGPSAPMLPVAAMLVGIHVYVLWYFFGGEFEDDFEDEENVPFFSEFVAKGRSLSKSTKNYVESIFTFLPSHRSSEPELNEEEKDLVS